MMFWIEIVATFFGFLCVLLIIRRSVWCWPTGLVQVSLFIIIFYQARLYSDMILHVIYVGMQFYGWYCWTAGRVDTKEGADDGASKGEIAVESLNAAVFGAWIAITMLGTVAVGLIMSTFTDASLPYADAFTTVASLVAQYLLARKYLQNWMMWIAVDVVAIGVYYYKALVPTTILYSAFLILAIAGLVIWQRRLTQQRLAGAVI